LKVLRLNLGFAKTRLSEGKITFMEEWKLLEATAKRYFIEEYKAKVWLWKEYAREKGVSEQDTGIDLVVELDGKLYGVQCKKWGKEVKLNDLGTFLLKIQKMSLDGGFIIADKISKKAEEELKGLEKPIVFIPANRLEPYKEKVKKSVEEFEHKVKQEKEIKQLRPYQEEAVRAILEGFKLYDRGQLIMPPGTGKTLVALKVAESEFLKPKGRVLFLCPSIALLDQTIRAWRQNSEVEFHAFAVVSDEKTGTVEHEELPHKVSLLAYPAMTNAEELKKQIESLKDDKPIVVFSTYQSFDVIEQAGLEFDLVVCDEAHRTAGIGKVDSEFKKVHKYEKVKKRLYMTATPRVYDVKGDENGEVPQDIEIYDMRDEKTFGPVFYKYSFKRAIEEGYLSPYSLLVLAVDKKVVSENLNLKEHLNSEGALNLDDTTKVVALGNLLRGIQLEDTNSFLKVKSGIVFTTLVKSSKSIAENFPKIYRKYFGEEPTAVIEHIDGTMSASIKRQKIENLAKGTEDRPYVLSNAKVLTEGIDVPSLDFVAFFDPKESVVDIIQAIGRVVRKAEGKERGIVFVPLIINSDADPSEQLEKSSYRHLWRIMNALASLDDSYLAQIRVFLIKQSEKAGGEGDKVFITAKDVKLPNYIYENIRRNLTIKLVKNFGLGKAYLNTWAKDTAEIAKNLQLFIKSCLKEQEFKQHYDGLKKTLQELLNESVADEDVQSFIVQYLLTKPIMDAVFEKRSSIDSVLDEIFGYFKNFLENNTESLKEFYEQVKNKAKGLVDEAERQEFLRKLYNDFFKIAFKEVVDQVGIAYTPVPLVEFVVKFTDHLLKKHFNKGLEDEGVVVLDPFAGVGTFLSVLVDYLPSDKVEQKVENKELWANEILLLPYLIMVKNVESAIRKKTGQDVPFESALWTDSFKLMSAWYNANAPIESLFKVPKGFKDLMNAQNSAKINVIISNPPWRAGRENENVGKKNVEYPELRQRIEQTYVEYAKKLGTTLVNSLYDLYFHAVRMASDRIEQGVIGLVLNNGWLDSLTGRGFRKALVEEFEEIYVYNLKGDARKQGEARRKEGEGVFGEHSRAGVCLLFLVKKKDKKGLGKVYYREVDDYLKVEQKFEHLKDTLSKLNSEGLWREITPSNEHDWLLSLDKDFKNMMPLDKIFVVSSLGLNTGRDRYAFNFSEDALRENMERLIETFNEHLKRAKNGEITKENIEDVIEKDLRKIKWDGRLKKYLLSKSAKEQSYDEEKVRPAFYRAFVKMYVYFDNVFNNRVYQLKQIFPTKEAKNLVIVVSGKGSDEFDVMISDRIVSYGYLSSAVIYPLYRYKEEFGKLKQLINIKESALKEFSSRVGREVKPWEVFYYVFGFLASPEYKQKYGHYIKVELPRVRLPKDEEEFVKTVELGKALADILLNYENLNPKQVYELNEDERNELLIDVKFKQNELVLNGRIKIPLSLSDYKVGGKHPIRWICEYLKRTQDKETEIVWDPKLTIGQFVELVGKLLTLEEKVMELIK